MATEKVMKQKVKGKKNIKKKFYEVDAPVTSVKISLYASEPEELDGKVVTIDLTRNLRGKNLELRIKIKVDGEKIYGEPISVNLIQGYVRRMMRRGTDYVEDSFEVPCRNLKVRIKFFLITRNRVSRAVRNALRVAAKKFLEGHLKSRDSDEVFSEIISNKLQRALALKLKKIYPLAVSEIRVFEILGELDKKEFEEAEEEKSEDTGEIAEEKKEVKKPSKKSSEKKEK